jgi:hypothetical protein
VVIWRRVWLAWQAVCLFVIAWRELYYYTSRASADLMSLTATVVVAILDICIASVWVAMHVYACYVACCAATTLLLVL